MRELKVSTSVWMKERGLFPLFDGWADGYGSFTCSYMDLGDLIDYIKNQQEHHNCRPPVSPEVIHITPHKWLPCWNRSAVFKMCLKSS
jgi:hypothetical protein